MHRNRYGLWQRCPKPASGCCRGQELVARRTGRVEDRIGVILAVAQQVAATMQFWNHFFTNFISLVFMGYTRYVSGTGRPPQIAYNL